MPLVATLAAASLAAADEGAAVDGRFAAFLAANPVPENVVCGYTSTATSSEYPGEVRIERYDVDGGWQLAGVNGEPPSAKALADYADGAEERDRQRQSTGAMDFAAMVKPDTVRVVEETDATIVFGFTPESPEGGRERALMKHMTGRLHVAKPELRPLAYRAALEGPASPMPTMKLQEFRQEMAFEVEPTTGASMIKSMAFAMRGKVFVFRKIDVEAEIAFSDYECRESATQPTE